MTLIEIENLSTDELKKRRDELVAEAAKADAKELAARYVQARCDAAMRDDKLREQGVTINTLNDALATAKESIKQLSSALNERNAALADLAKKHAAHCAAHGEACAKLQADAKAALEKVQNEAAAALVAATNEINATRAALAKETARANRNAALAARCEGAINEIAARCNDLIAKRQVETTNEGA